MPITFPSSYGLDPKNFIQGPIRAWYAPYVASGADPSTGNIVSLGLVDKGGFEWDHKLTYSETELDQSTVPADAFLSKQEYDVKINFLELSPANLNIFLGFNAASLVSGGGINTQSMGEPFDVQAGANPSMRPTYRQLMLQFPSSGHDNTTSPIGAWGYLQLFKTYVQSHGAIKFNKDSMAMVAVTFRALADFTVSGAYKMGKLILQ